MKLKETLKTITLTGLVISTLVLSSRIWLSEELWPDGYNSFLSMFFSAFEKPQTESLDLAQIYYPKQILISKNNRSVIITTTGDRYEGLNGILKDHIKASVCSNAVAESNDEEYKKACKEGDSLYIGLYSYISFEMLADYYDASITDATKELNHIKNILLCPSSDGKSFTLFAKNSETKKIYKINVSQDVSNLQSVMNSLTENVNEGSVAASFAFENNFDKKNESDTGRILLDSYMLINLNELSTPDITAVNLLNLEKFTKESYDKIFRYFGVNTNTARRFTDTTGTVNLIENFGTLKLHTDGLLEYTSMNEGIDLDADISSDYDAVKLAGEFTEGVNNLFNLPENNSYVFAGVSWDEDNVYTVSFDLLYKGVPIVMSREISGNEILKHPIEVKLKDGKILSYRQMFCGFNSIGTNSTIPNMISVLDKFYTVFDVRSNPDIVINDIYSVYHFDSRSSTVKPGNGVLLSDGKVVMVE